MPRIVFQQLCRGDRLFDFLPSDVLLCHLLMSMLSDADKALPNLGTNLLKEPLGPLSLHFP